ncbi:MAG TPA: AraC family transcriptional regulator [Holophaga sp.]|nr:AraC family transcriptional regulator [Holophaga sp.]
MARAMKDAIRIWRPEGIPGVELMDAQVLKHHWPKHFNEAYTVGFNVAGAGAFSCRGAMQVPVLGSLHLLTPQDLHTGQAAGEEAWVYRSLLLGPAFLEGLGEQIEGRRRPLSFRQPVVQDEGLSDALAHACGALDPRSGWSTDALERESLLLETLGQVMRRYADLSAAARRPERRAVQRVRACIEDRFREPVTLEELSVLAGLAPHHMIDVFQRETGVPPHAYLNLVRVSRAKALLRQGGSLAEVALACGYCDQSHLNRWFRRITGLTPRQYQLGGLSSKTR